MRPITCLLLSSTLMLVAGLPLAASEHEDASADLDRNTSTLKKVDRHTEQAESPPNKELLRCLSEWERASAKLRPLTKTEKQQVGLSRRVQYSGHELAVICDFCGPVCQAELLKHYRWIGCRRVGDTVRVTAEPRDMTESLFFREFRLALHATSWLPRSIEFTDRQGGIKGGPMLLTGYLNLELNRSSQPLAGDSESTLLEKTASLHETDESQVRLASARTLQRDIQTQHETDVGRILRSWRQSAARFQSLEVDFERLSYDNTFKVVKGATGTLYYEAPRKFRIDLRPADAMIMQRVPARDKGQDYEYKRESLETWIYSDAKLLRIDHLDKTYARFGHQHGWLRLLKNAVQMFVLSDCPEQWSTFSDTPADERFRVTIAERSDHELQLLFEPRRPDDANCFRVISITVDARTYATKMTEIVDPTAQAETVLVFDRERARVNRPWRSGEDPFRPNLDGYHQH